MDKAMTRTGHTTALWTDQPAQQAYQILHLGFVVAPLVAGLDKFFNVLTSWDRYLAPTFAALVPIAPQTFMRLVGVVELAAAALVLLKPRVGAYVVAGWLAAIIVNLVAAGGFFDVALRDLGLLLGALALGRLATEYDRTEEVKATRTT